MNSPLFGTLHLHMVDSGNAQCEVVRELKRRIQTQGAVQKVCANSYVRPRSSSAVAIIGWSYEKDLLTSQPQSLEEKETFRSFLLNLDYLKVPSIVSISFPHCGDE
jgi:hypothetical protein